MVLLLKRGDISSFDKLYLKFHKKIYLFARGILKSHEDAESVVQDVFIKVWEKRMDLDEYQSFESFLFTVSYNAAISLIRKKLSEKRFLEEYARRLEKEKQVANEAEYFDLRQRTQQLIDQLPQRRRQVYLMSREEGLSYAEIASRLEISVNTVENHMTAALKFLRNNLGESLTVVFFCIFFL
jgi:RNA polymerase sigma-70 factor (ECF subfamily)